MIEASQPLTIQQQQQLQNPPPLKHQIPLPRSSPPELRPIDPIPPPQYEEATKQQLQNCKKQLQQKILNANKKKTSLTVNSITNDAVKTVTKSVPLSQDMTDVLEILIKRGELPENAVEPTTPNSQIQTTLMINPNLMFESHQQPTQVVVQQQQQQQPVTQTLPHQSPQSQTQVEQSPSSITTAPYSSEIPSSILLDSTSDVLSMTNVMSPMQQDVHEETLDKLLGQAQSNDIHTPHNSPLHPNHHLHHNHQQQQQQHSNQQNHSLMHNGVTHHHLPTDFSELDFMDMDVMDVDHHHTFPQLFTGNNNNNSVGCSNGVNDKSRRDMNPSLTPSLNELIQLQQQQQQQQHQSHYHTSQNNSNLMTNGFSFGSSTNGDGLNNNSDNTTSSNHSTGLGFTDTPMDFENLLNNFEIPSNLTDTPPEQSSHCGNGDLSNSSNGYQQSNTDHQHHHDNFFELFNDDFRMSNDSMTCEVDNLMINI